MKKFEIREINKKNLTRAYAQYLEKEFGKEFYNDIGSLVTAKYDAELWVPEALSDNILDEYEINSLDEFVKIMGEKYADGYCSIEVYNDIIEGNL
jgi:hypothetical protein